MDDVLLSKQVLKKKLAYVFSSWGVSPNVRKSIREAIDKSVATDAVYVVHGYWKYPKSQDPECSVCGCSYDREEGGYASMTEYCGNCGAIVDKEVTD